jgi:hypothetical protein
MVATKEPASWHSDDGLRRRSLLARSNTLAGEVTGGLEEIFSLWFFASEECAGSVPAGFVRGSRHRWEDQALPATTPNRPGSDSSIGLRARCHPVRATGFSERTVSVPPRDYLLAGRLLVAAAERDVDGSTREALAEAARALGAEAGTRKKGRAASGSARRRALVAALRERATSLRGRQRRDSAAQLPLSRARPTEPRSRLRDEPLPLSGLLAGLDTNDFSPSLEIEPGRCCVALRPRAQEQPPP